MRILLASFLPLQAPARAGGLATHAVAVVDGDTLTVERPDHARVRVRLAGVAAPELGQPGDDAARLATGDLAPGPEVVVPGSGTDRSGRTVEGDIAPIVADRPGRDGNLMNSKYIWLFWRVFGILSRVLPDMGPVKSEQIEIRNLIESLHPSLGGLVVVVDLESIGTLE